jgi:hypothetical protein
MKKLIFALIITLSLVSFGYAQVGGGGIYGVGGTSLGTLTGLIQATSGTPSIITPPAVGTSAVVGWNNAGVLASYTAPTWYDAYNFTVNVADPTKALNWDLSSILTGTVRTGSWPNASGTVAVQSSTSTTTTHFLKATSTAGVVAPSAIASGDIPAAAEPPVPTVTGGSGPTIVIPKEYYVCTTTCSVALPAPTTAGYEYCVRNANNVNTVITLSDIASNYFELPAKTAYTASGKGLHSGGAVTDQICVVSDGANHYLIMNYTGTWVTN